MPVNFVELAYNTNEDQENFQGTLCLIAVGVITEINDIWRQVTR